MHQWFNVPCDNKGSGKTGAETAKEKGKEVGREAQRADAKKAMFNMQVLRSTGMGSTMMRENAIATVVKEEQAQVMAETAQAQRVALEKRTIMQEYDQKLAAAEKKMQWLQQRCDKMLDGPAKDDMQVKLDDAEKSYFDLLEKGAAGVLANYVPPPVPSVTDMRKKAQETVAKRDQQQWESGGAGGNSSVHAGGQDKEGEVAEQEAAEGGGQEAA